jgi:hypothetical protein
MVEMLTIAANHAYYEKTCISKDAKAPQLRGVKVAFYAGASAVLYVIEEMAKSKDPEASLKVLRQLHNEIRDFDIAVRTGKA